MVRGNWKMRLLHALTFAGQVGLTSGPGAALIECSRKNIICGVANYGKYIRAADVVQHLSYVLEYLFDELGETILDLSHFLVKTGTVLVVIDLAKYIGIALGCVAIDETLRYLGILGDDGSRFITSCRRLPELCTSDVPAITDGREDVPVGEVDIASADVCCRSSTSWTHVTTWGELTRNGTEQEVEKKEGKMKEGDELEKNERCPRYESDSRDTPMSENDHLRIFRNGGKPKRLVFVMDDLHLESAGNTPLTAAEGACAPFTDVFVNRVKVSQLQNKTTASPLQKESREELPLRLRSARQTTYIYSYDADVSDEGNTADSSPAHRSRVTGSEMSHPTTEQHPGLLPSLRGSTSSSRYETSSKNTKTGRQSRLKASKGQWDGDYTNLKRLHSLRSFHRTDVELNCDLVTQTSSEEFTGFGSGTSSQSTRKRTPPPTRRRGKTSTDTHTENESLLDSSENVFDASSYILSSRSVSSDERPRVGAFDDAGWVTESGTNHVPLNTQPHWNTPREEGVQQFTFCQLPLSHASATKLLPGQNTGFLREPHGSRPAHSDISSCDLPQQDGRQRSSQAHNTDDTNHQIVEVSPHQQDGNIQSHSPSSPPANICRDLSCARHGPARGRHVQDAKWRVLFIKIVSWIFLGRKWRKYF